MSDAAILRPATAPERPLLRPGLRLVADGGRVLAEHGQRVVVLAGRAAERLLPELLPLLDGRRSAAAIAEQLAVPPLAVENALRLLARHGLLCEGPPLDGLPRALRETAESLAAAGGLPPALVAARLQGRLAVVGRSRVAAEVRRLLTTAGVPVLPPGRRRAAAADFLVAAPGRGEAGALRGWNRRSLRRRLAWLPVLPFDGRVVLVGPLVVPGETACYECLLLRRAAAAAYGSEAALLERVQPAARSGFPLDELAAAVAALQALRWVGTADPGLPGVLQTVAFADGVTLARHRVLRVPRCPACSVVASTAAALPWHDVPIEATS